MFDRFRIFAAYLIAIPLALILGVLTAAPGQTTFMLIGMLLFFLALPLLLKWHHAMLIIFWNSAFSAFFFPGQPTFWLMLAVLSFGMSVLNYVMGRRQFLPVPEMRWPLFFFVLVVIATALFRGGIGIKSLGGGSNGGKNYVYILGAVIGFYAFTARAIPPARAQRMTSLFFLSETSYILANLAYTLGPAFYFVYYLVPSTMAMDQAANDVGLTTLDRIQGLAPTCIGVLCCLLGVWGLRGLLDWTRPWRFLLLCTTLVVGLFAGFRSVLALAVLLLAFEFYFEGLFRTRVFPAVLAIGSVALACVFLFSTKMPLPIQRTMSFLPITVDAGVREDATGSSQWRFDMWNVVERDIPHYLIAGKGYVIDPVEMYLTQQAIHMGLISTYEEALLAGDFHNGPLSVIIPFGLAGALTFLWMLYAGGRVLHLNYRFGDLGLRRANTLLISFYLANCVTFFIIFGALSSQLFVFLGTVGLSVSLNGGVKRKADITEISRVAARQPYAVELK